MLQLKLLSIDDKLRKQNVGYYKQSIDKSKLNEFKLNLSKFIKDIDDIAKNKRQREESLKEKIIFLLKDNFYLNNKIDIIENIDLAILDTINATNTVEVIFELKTPQNSGEMITKSNPNAKALNQLVHYYMQERLAGNDELKHLIATNGFEWYIFDAVDFEKLFYKNDTFFKQYEKWDKKQTVDSTTVSVYDNIKNFLDNNEINLEATYFDLRDYQQYLNSSNEKDIENIIYLYKIFSPQHLLKLSFANYSNTLNKEFYNELLYILGLEERTENGKNIISRANANNRQSASLIENTINQLKIKANITDDDQLFEIALELCITWLNRILFLKLLEGQLIKFHNDDKVGFSFMNIDKIKEFDDLNELFFEVLALPEKDRSDNIKEKYKNVPYLNSSLFELTNYEREYITINSLKDSLVLPIFRSTVLKDANGKPRTDKLLTLNYLFEFLNSYDFSSDSGARVQRDNRPIINAAVLGLIFEKINGYKDGSYFTPGYITEYMCRESISRAVVQKFKENENQEFDTLDDVKNYCSLHHKVEDIKRFNGYINSLRICDPAVGSGHFLVSALNVLIAIKSELNILADDGVLIDYDVSVDNDELIIINKNNNKPYKYFLVDGKKPTTEVQNIQRVLFNEKVHLIENCLFGVDINSKSVQITRLRLWIELLKNAYYKAPDYKELETLPNIDINIKCGDSLISRYTLDSDLKPALRNSIWNIVTYKNAIASYHKPRSKKEKGEILKLINDIKNNFETEISQNHPLKKKQLNLSSKLYKLQEKPLFEYTENEKLKLDKDVKNITNEIKKIESELEDIKNGEIYKNAFEWRFEFPEVLDDDGNYIGFDVVIGNPPYIRADNPEIKKQREEIKKYNAYETLWEKWDLYVAFIERGFKLLTHNGILEFIIPDAYMTSKYAIKSHQYFLKNSLINRINFCSEIKIFQQAVKNIIIEYKKASNENHVPLRIKHVGEWNNFVLLPSKKQSEMGEKTFKIDIENKTFGDLSNTLTWGEICYVSVGMVLNADENISKGEFTKEDLIQNIKDKIHSKAYIEAKWLEKYRIKQIKYLEWNTQRVPSKIRRPTFPELYIPEKILMGRMTGATYDSTGLVCNDSIIVSVLWKDLKSVSNRSIEGSIKKDFKIKKIYPFRNQLEENSKLFNLKYLLAILNSKFAYKFLDTIRRSQIGFYPNDLKKLPIKKISEEEQQPFIDLVNKILTEKNKDPNSDTTALEHEIDELVYRLYDLTEDEIKIVEGN